MNFEYQARMHIRNNDNPYMSTQDAMTYWPEQETAVGAGGLSSDSNIELVAPFGCNVLFSNSITFNNKSLKIKDFKDRVERKQWLQKWPIFTVGIGR